MLLLPWFLDAVPEEARFSNPLPLQRNAQAAAVGKTALAPAAILPNLDAHVDQASPQTYLNPALNERVQVPSCVCVCVCEREKWNAVHVVSASGVRSTTCRVSVSAPSHSPSERLCRDALWMRCGLGTCEQYEHAASRPARDVASCYLRVAPACLPAREWRVGGRLESRCTKQQPRFNHCAANCSSSCSSHIPLHMELATTCFTANASTTLDHRAMRPLAQRQNA